MRERKGERESKGERDPQMERAQLPSMDRKLNCMGSHQLCFSSSLTSPHAHVEEANRIRCEALMKPLILLMWQKHHC